MFNPLAQSATKECVQYLPQNFNVVEIGNQTMSSGPDLTVKEYYLGLGASDYTALDVNERKDAKIADLNCPIGAAFVNSAELITNNGSSEHMFNQGQVFENIHNICKKNGLMLHILPLTPWINHGFYNYNPIFFRDLGRVNDYEIKFFWLANRWGDRVALAEQDYDELFKEKNPTVLIQNIAALYNEAEVHKDIFSTVCFKKTSSKAFKVPMQSKYIKDIEGEIKSK